MAIIETVAAQAPLMVEQVLGVVQRFFTILSALLGGLFGLYFIYLFVRLFYDRKIMRELHSIKQDIHEIQKKLKIKK